MYQLVGYYVTRECASCGIVSIRARPAVCIGFSGKCTRPVFCSNFVLRVRFIVSVTGSVSYLNENFVVFSLCGTVCRVPGVLTAVCIAPESHNSIHNQNDCSRT